MVFLLMFCIVFSFIGGCQKTAEEKPLIVATCEASPPFSYYDENNKLTGFNIDYSNEISSRIGQKVVVQSVVWDTIIAGLQADKFDMIIGTMSITPERQKAVHFTDVYFTDATTIAIAKDSECKTLESLAGKRVGVLIGSNYADDAKKFIKDPVIVDYKTEMEIFQDLQIGRIDATVHSRKVMEYAKVKNPDYTFVLFDKDLYEDPCGIAIKNGNDELYSKVNEAVKSINTDGTLQSLQKKWFGV